MGLFFYIMVGNYFIFVKIWWNLGWMMCQFQSKIFIVRPVSAVRSSSVTDLRGRYDTPSLWLSNADSHTDIMVVFVFNTPLRRNLCWAMLDIERSLCFSRMVWLNIILNKITPQMKGISGRLKKNPTEIYLYDWS